MLTIQPRPMEQSHSFHHVEMDAATHPSSIRSSRPGFIIQRVLRYVSVTPLRNIRTSPRPRLDLASRPRLSNLVRHLWRIYHRFHEIRSISQLSDVTNQTVVAAGSSYPCLALLCLPPPASPRTAVRSCSCSCLLVMLHCIYRTFQHVCMSDGTASRGGIQ